jgi:Mannosyl-glycoprotein endo-beta-N-acetylglucosaminidase
MRRLTVLAVAVVVAAGCASKTHPPPPNPTSVMGPSSLTANQIAAWFEAEFPDTRSYKANASPRALAELFVWEATQENVRGDIAFAQSVVETNWFTYGNQVQWWQNNYAGIGACDSCNGGIVFPSPHSGIRAQIQHLRNYADAGSRTSNLHNPPVPELYSPASKFNTFFKKGAAPDWTQMGNGNWASSTTYATTVLTMYNRMRAYNGLAPV